MSLSVRDHHEVMLDLVRRQFRLRRTSLAVNQRQQIDPPIGEPGHRHGICGPAVLTLGTAMMIGMGEPMIHRFKLLVAFEAQPVG